MVGRQRSSVLAAAYVVLVLLFLYLPVAVTVMFSFADSPRLSMPIEGLTLDWYRRAFSNPLMGVAVRNSVILAAVSAIAAGALGAGFAFGVIRMKSRRLRGVLLGASLLPAVIPLLVIGISLAVAFSAIGWLQGLRNAAFGHVLVCLPFVVLTMNARLETFDFSILEAARDLGASPFRAFLDITLPIIRPSILGAALLAAALSLDEFVVTWFNIGSQQTLPVLVWGLVRRGVDPSINAVASLLLFSLICLVGISNLSAWRRRR
ncbi:MAG: ABC transporter permease subunit [Rhizobiales bacterium]|nr:ABC transporter permease subunit [Hyphomicrobiales bacterium]